MTKEIPLSRDRVALVDDGDFEWLTNCGPWHAAVSGKRFYAVHTQFTAPASFKAIRMHRLLLPGAQFVDHINRDSLDNRRDNLRAATAAENARNRSRRSDSRWKFKGVHPIISAANPWVASIYVDGQARHLGAFPTQEDAARAYDEAATAEFGSFAHLNFPEGIAS